MGSHFCMFLYLRACFVCSGAEIPVQIVPQGIESVNGSDITMGCASQLVDRGGGMMICDNSYLVDGCSPSINTSTSNWASQLVTVRKNEGNEFDHVLLTFDFNTTVSLSSIELDLFLCPKWNIGAPGIFVYAYQNNTLVFNQDTGVLIGIRSPLKSKPSCNSLSTIGIRFLNRLHDISSYRSLHILVDFTSEDINWIYVGEIRFFPPANHTHMQNCNNSLSG